MLAQVVGHDGDAALGKIVLACHAHALERSNSPCTQRTVFQVADADGKLRTLIEQIDEAVVDLQIQLQARKAPQNSGTSGITY